MLGWHISVYRLPGPNPAPPSAVPPDETETRALLMAAESPGKRVAVWQTGLGGLDWIHELVDRREAVALPGNGYPDYFCAPSSRILPQVLDGPPHAKAVWTYDPGDVIGPGWEGQTVIDRSAAARCRPEEWLLVVAWDES